MLVGGGEIICNHAILGNSARTAHFETALEEKAKEPTSSALGSPAHAVATGCVKADSNHNPRLKLPKFLRAIGLESLLEKLSKRRPAMWLA